MPKLDWVTNLEVGFHLREDTELSPEGGAHQAAGRKGSSLEMPRLPSQVLPMEAPPSHLLCKSRRSLSATSTLSSFKSWRNSLSKSTSMSSTWESE